MGGGLGGLGGKGEGKGNVAVVARDIARLSRDTFALTLLTHTFAVCGALAFGYAIDRNRRLYRLHRLGVIVQSSDKLG